MRSALWSCVLILVFGYTNPGKAGEPSPFAPTLPHIPFSRGAKEVELLAGAFFSVDSGYSYRPTINLASENFRFGIMLADPRGLGLLAGNTELLFEVSAGEIFAGPGTTIDGASLLLRYNFVRPHARVVPYCQIGIGGAYNDIVRTQWQSLLGSEFQVLLQGEIGVRVILNERLSLLVESGLVHLSNAGLTQRNHGLNCPGGLAGVALSF